MKTRLHILTALGPALPLLLPQGCVKPRTVTLTVIPFSAQLLERTNPRRSSSRHYGSTEDASAV